MKMQEVVVEEDEVDFSEALSHSRTPIPKVSRSDVHFPLTAPKRARATSITSLADIVEALPLGRLTVRVRGAVSDEAQIKESNLQDAEGTLPLSPPAEQTPHPSIHDLPLEVQGNVLDYIFGDMHSITSGSTSLQGKNVSSSMRHPRRKAVSELALVSATWRDLVQERIYRHIKIKGTRMGLQESSNWFCFRPHLTKHIRHIEFWVPVWGDKASVDRSSFDTSHLALGRNGFHQLADHANGGLMSANELLGFNFKLSTYSATLAEIFSHAQCYFPDAKILTLEGGHCKKSNMIHHFPKRIFPEPNERLDILPNIKTFAMRGTWNIMREYDHWRNLERALPNVSEWHCCYAKPRLEAYTTINEILFSLPNRLRHVNISLDGMYSKDNTTIPSNSSLPHLCDQLGSIIPQLESLSYTGKVCACFWASAVAAVRESKRESRLKHLEIVVKSCCRPRLVLPDSSTSSPVTITVDDVSGSSIMADGTGITNMSFIRAFERLTVATVSALNTFPHLANVRIRYIDLDSACPFLNPYFQLRNGKCYGLWNEEILDILPEVRPGLTYEELGEGIDGTWRKEDVVVGTIWGRVRGKPKSIKSSSYKMLSEARM